MHFTSLIHLWQSTCSRGIHFYYQWHLYILKKYCFRQGYFKMTHISNSHIYSSSSNNTTSIIVISRQSSEFSGLTGFKRKSTMTWYAYEMQLFILTLFVIIIWKFYHSSCHLLCDKCLSGTRGVFLHTPF